jgi:hypothetical protein
MASTTIDQRKALRRGWPVCDASFVEADGLAIAMPGQSGGRLAA